LLSQRALNAIFIPNARVRSAAPPVALPRFPENRPCSFEFGITVAKNVSLAKMRVLEYSEL
jgi:hypothetical protein